MKNLILFFLVFIFCNNLSAAGAAVPRKAILLMPGFKEVPSNLAHNAAQSAFFAAMTQMVGGHPNALIDLPAARARITAAIGDSRIPFNVLLLNPGAGNPDEVLHVGTVRTISSEAGVLTTEFVTGDLVNYINAHPMERTIKTALVTDGTISQEHSALSRLLTVRSNLSSITLQGGGRRDDNKKERQALQKSLDNFPDKRSVEVLITSASNNVLRELQAFSAALQAAEVEIGRIVAARNAVDFRDWETLGHADSYFSANTLLAGFHDTLSQNILGNFLNADKAGMFAAGASTVDERVQTLDSLSLSLLTKAYINRAARSRAYATALDPNQRTDALVRIIGDFNQVQENVSFFPVIPSIHTVMDALSVAVGGITPADAASVAAMKMHLSTFTSFILFIHRVAFACAALEKQASAFEGGAHAQALRDFSKALGMLTHEQIKKVKAELMGILQKLQYSPLQKIIKLCISMLPPFAHDTKGNLLSTKDSFTKLLNFQRLDRGFRAIVTRLLDSNAYQGQFAEAFWGIDLTSAIFDPIQGINAAREAEDEFAEIAAGHAGNGAEIAAAINGAVAPVPPILYSLENIYSSVTSAGTQGVFAIDNPSGKLAKAVVQVFNKQAERIRTLGAIIPKAFWEEARRYTARGVGHTTFNIDTVEKAKNRMLLLKYLIQNHPRHAAWDRGGAYDLAEAERNIDVVLAKAAITGNDNPAIAALNFANNAHNLANGAADALEDAIAAAAAYPSYNLAQRQALISALIPALKAELAHLLNLA